MMRKSTGFTLLLFVLAFLIWGYAFSVDPLWPNQDMTPDMQVQYEHDQRAVAELYQTGSYFLLGAVVMTIYKITQMRRKNKEST